MQVSIVVLAAWAVFTGCGTQSSQRSQSTAQPAPQTSQQQETEEILLADRSVRGSIFSPSQRQPRGRGEDLANTCEYIFRCEAKTASDVVVISWVPDRPASNGNRCDAGFRCPSNQDLLKTHLLSCEEPGATSNIAVDCIRNERPHPGSIQKRKGNLVR